MMYFSGFFSEEKKLRRLVSVPGKYQRRDALKLQTIFFFFFCRMFHVQAKSVTPRFVQCHGNQTPMCMKMRLLWSVCLEFVGPMDPFLIRVCVHV